MIFNKRILCCIVFYRRTTIKVFLHWRSFMVFFIYICCSETWDGQDQFYGDAGDEICGW